MNFLSDDEIDAPLWFKAYDGASTDDETDPDNVSDAGGTDVQLEEDCPTHPRWHETSQSTCDDRFGHIKIRKLTPYTDFAAVGTVIVRDLTDRKTPGGPPVPHVLLHVRGGKAHTDLGRISTTGGIMPAGDCLWESTGTVYDAATERYMFPQFQEQTKQFAANLIHETINLKMGPREQLKMFPLPAMRPEGTPSKFDEKHRRNWGIYVTNTTDAGVPLRLLQPYGKHS